MIQSAGSRQFDLQRNPKNILIESTVQRLFTKEKNPFLK